MWYNWYDDVDSYWIRVEFAKDLGLSLDIAWEWIWFDVRTSDGVVCVGFDQIDRTFFFEEEET